MSNQQLIDYIKQAQAAGQSKEQIRAALLGAGWREADVDEALGVAVQPSFVASGGHEFDSRSLGLIHWFLWLRKKYIILLALIIVLIGAYFFLAKDIAPVNDLDLRLENIPLFPESQNAYYDLVKIGDDIYEPEDILDYLAGKKWDEDIIKEALAKNESVLSLFDAAARKEKFQNPLYADPGNISIDMELTPINLWRKIARLSALKALYLAKRGKDSEAINEALKSVRIGQKIQDSQALMIEYLVAMAMKSIGLSATQKIIASSKLSGTELSRYAQDISQFDQNENGFETVFKGEYIISYEMINALAEWRDKGSTNSAFLSWEIGHLSFADRIINFLKFSDFYFQPNRTKALLAEYTRLAIIDLDKPCRFIEKLIIKEPSLFKSFFTKNATGEVFQNDRQYTVGTIIIRKCQEDLLVYITKLMLALKEYEIDHNILPYFLDELVPQYVSRVSLDPFDGKPIRYSKDKKIIYSVGEDGVDSGGSAGDDWRKMPDPTFSVDFAPSASTEAL